MTRTFAISMLLLLPTYVFGYNSTGIAGLTSADARIQQSLLSIQKDALTSENREDLIQRNIDKGFPVTRSAETEVGLTVAPAKDMFSEGTGTRGGGSGIRRQGAKGQQILTLTDLYRSENRSIYKEFFQTDSELLAISQQKTPEAAADLIFEKVIARISAVAPNFALKIKSAAAEMPLSTWTAALSPLPLLDDHVELSKDPIKDRVQIAYRRANKIIYDQALYTSLDGLNRAALRLHEYIYALSGTISSLQTQRAVSLFFSSEFESIAKDERRLTMLFWELGILNISRKTIQVPPGSALIDPEAKLPEICGIMMRLKMDPLTRTGLLEVQLPSSLVKLSLSTIELMVFGNAMIQTKDALNKKFAIYKYPAQAVAPDIVCVSTATGKLSSLEVALMYDARLHKADLENAQLESNYYRAQSEYLNALAAQSGAAIAAQKLEEFKSVEEQLRQSKAQLESLRTPTVAQVLNPTLLGKYKVRF